MPLLVTGRLGDRFGPKRIYLLGLVVFTLSSAWAGLVGSVEWLIVARIVQGLGAALLTPQTMAVVTRIFPPASRGRAMSLWGAAAAVATLVGPILGGFIVDAMGGEWIFFVNVPIGIIGFVLGFAAAMLMSMLLPAGAALLGVIFTLAFTERHERQAWRPPSAAEPPLAEPVH